MSHYTTLETRILSAEHLVAALSDMGFDNVEHYKTAQPLEGYEGNLRDERAEVIVRRKHVGFASNDIGFKRDAKGFYRAIISEFDRDKYDKAWLDKLTQRYAYRLARDTLAEQGFDLVSEEMDSRKTIRMTVRRMG